MEEQLYNQDNISQEERANQIINSWVDKYKEVFFTTINDNEFIYRLLSNKEYLELKDKAETPGQLEELICQRCVLDPIVEWDDEIFAGYPSSLALDILEQSLLVSDKDNPVDIGELIQTNYEYVSTSLSEQIPLVIKKSFPEYTLEEIELMPMVRQIKLFNQSRWIIETLTGINLEYDMPEQQ